MAYRLKRLGDKLTLSAFDGDGHLKYCDYGATKTFNL